MNDFPKFPEDLKSTMRDVRAAMKARAEHFTDKTIAALAATPEGRTVLQDLAAELKLVDAALSPFLQQYQNLQSLHYDVLNASSTKPAAG
jgi:hypothetical protein